eukprot:m.97704 g.97704  ORF g.97704 m.97704 type:complete len:173 (+) comp13610_c0_seq2:197-715(+)
MFLILTLFFAPVTSSDYQRLEEIQCFNSSLTCGSIGVNSSAQCQFNCEIEGFDRSVYDDAVARNVSDHEDPACYCCGRKKFFCCNSKIRYDFGAIDLQCEAQQPNGLTKKTKSAVTAILVLLGITVLAIVATWHYKVAGFAPRNPEEPLLIPGDWRGTLRRLWFGSRRELVV